MKVVAFNGSPHPEGNTALLINTVLDRLQHYEIQTELVQLAGNPVRGCCACMQCRNNHVPHCVFTSDNINDCIAKMIEADGIIIGSPTYFANLTTETKALIDRAGYVTRGNGHLLKRKVGAAIVVARRAGAINVFNAINDFFLINEMIVPGSNYWNLGLGREPGDVANDSEGTKTMETLGDNLAWLLRKITGSDFTS
jgi:multimeric flavodoxin WrbA